ncbi:MAG: hypothetical protein IJQ08_03780 [Synergistaceae bacterium]|nr:hypothetical protein [Synergistaceae bacterium]
MEGIKPCPNCWGEGKLKMDWKYCMCYIACEDCETYTQLYVDEESAISDWNNGGVISRKEASHMQPESAEPPCVLQPEDIELRPCPKCGSEATINYSEYSNGYYGVCENEKCYVHTELFHSVLQAQDEWNGGAVSDTWYRRSE